MATLTMATLTMATLTMATLTILYVLYCTYGLRVPASVLYVLYVRATRTNLRTCINEKRFFLHAIRHWHQPLQVLGRWEPRRLNDYLVIQRFMN